MHTMRPKQFHKVTCPSINSCVLEFLVFSGSWSFVQIGKTNESDDSKVYAMRGFYADGPMREKRL